MKTARPLLISAESDLVARACDGDRDAYGQLVLRHQTLITSIAYSITGDFARSQEVAQDAFVSAWRQLRSLADRASFKAWLCGIARNLARNSIRRQSRRPDRLDAASSAPPECPDASPNPHEFAVSHEESTIVWLALKKLPDSYREPLVLFYREHQSISHVASALDLSEEAVKQRLSRGRALLRDQVENVIQRTLGRTRPDVLFTTAVLAALPAAAPLIVANAAASAAATAKTGAAAKAAVSLSGLSAWLIAPLLLGLTNVYLGARQSLRFARSAAERLFLKRLFLALGGLMLLSHACLFATFWFKARPLADRISPRALSLLIFASTWLLLAGFGILFFWARRRFISWSRGIRLPADAPRWRRRLWFGPDRAIAYRSRLTAFGLPLLDIRFGYSPDEPLVRGVASGWIALGDVAHGVLLAIGGVATGAIALGGIAVGGVTLGGAAIGLTAFGGAAIGGVACGLIAFGHVAAGSMIAFGFDTADGAIAVALHFARGALFSVAEHMNDSAARHAVDRGHAMRILAAIGYLPMFANAVLIPMLSMVATNAFIRRRYGDEDENPRRISRPPQTHSPGGFLVQFATALGFGAALIAAISAIGSHRFTRDDEVLVAIARDHVALAQASDEARAEARFALGRTLAQADRPAEALAEFLWCFDTGMRDLPGLAGTRRVSVLHELKELSSFYAPAKTALLERRDRAEADFNAGHARRPAILDAVSLNHILGEDQRSLALYDRLPPDSRLRGVVALQLFDALRIAQRYEDAARAESESFVLQRWTARWSAEIRRQRANFLPVVQRELNRRDVQWLAERIEVFAGAGQLPTARALLAAARSYDNDAGAQALYRAALARARRTDLLDANPPPERGAN